MIRKCHACGEEISHYDKRCGHCGAGQSSPKLIRKAGMVIRRLAKPISGSRLRKDPKR